MPSNASGLSSLTVVLFAFEFDRAAGAPGGGEERDFLMREIAFLEHVADELAHGAGCADDSDMNRTQAESPRTKLTVKPSGWKTGKPQVGFADHRRCPI